MEMSLTPSTYIIPTEPVVLSPVNSIAKPSIIVPSAPAMTLIVELTSSEAISAALIVKGISITKFLAVKSPNKRVYPSEIVDSLFIVPSSLKKIL